MLQRAKSIPGTVRTSPWRAQRNHLVCMFLDKDLTLPRKKALRLANQMMAKTQKKPKLKKFIQKIRRRYIINAGSACQIQKHGTATWINFKTTKILCFTELNNRSRHMLIFDRDGYRLRINASLVERSNVS